ncbi:MAG: hypothetical protein ABSB82_10805 [Terriglobia bacterium]|jgi:hypothetical protein
MKPHALRVVLAVAGATLLLMLIDLAVFGFHFALPAWRVILAHLLTVSVLAYVAWSARAHGWRLAAAVFLLFFVLSYFNTLDEGVLFLELSPALVLGALVVGLLTSAAVAGLLVWLMGKGGAAEPSDRPSLPARSAGGWLWRLVAGDFAYVVLYFAAGMIVFPFVKDFYADKTLPGPGTIVLMQLFRALVYIAAALPIARMIPQRRHAALALGLAFSILGGVAPLLPDNPLMPPHIRFAHTIEVGVSNFIFGVVLALLFTPRPAREALPVAAEARHASA